MYATKHAKARFAYDNIHVPSCNSQELLPFIVVEPACTCHKHTLVFSVLRLYLQFKTSFVHWLMNYVDWRVVGPLVLHNEAEAIFTISRLPIFFGLLYNAFEVCLIKHVVVACYGMKEPYYFDLHGWAPLSTDDTVTRRFDIGVNKRSNEIVFIGVTDELRQHHNDKVFRMCSKLGQGNGSVCYLWTGHHREILQGSCVTVYPLLMHQLKMRLPRMKMLLAYILV